MYRKFFDRPGQVGEKGSQSQVKEAFSHTNADQAVKDFHANSCLLEVTTKVGVWSVRWGCGV